MKIDDLSLQKCARGLVDLVLEGEGHALVFRELCAREPKLKGTSADVFFREYVPSKLALGCVFWAGRCAEHQIFEKEPKNFFFQEVMKLFQSPKSLGEATRFSESLYASNADTEQSPVVSVLVHLFHKLGLESVSKKRKGEAEELSAAFLFMTEVSDALKNAFEAKFDEYYYAHEAIRTKQKEGAG